MSVTLIETCSMFQSLDPTACVICFKNNQWVAVWKIMYKLSSSYVIYFGRTSFFHNSFISSNLIHNSYINSTKLNASTFFGRTNKGIIL